MASLLPNGEQQFIDANGVPLAGGKVYFYVPNTSTPKNTWKDSSQAILNTNPVILDAAGRAIIYGIGQYRQVVQDSLGNTIWDQLTSDTSAAGASSNPGFNAFVQDPITFPTTPTSGLIISLPSGSVIFPGSLAPVPFPAVNMTLADNTLYDFWLTPLSTWNIQSAPNTNYTILPHYSSGYVHVWRAQTTNGKISLILPMTNTYPTPIRREVDRSYTIDSFVEQFYLFDSTTNWSAGLAVTYGQLLLVTTGSGAGNVYQVVTPGITGGTAPTSTDRGNINDGTAILFYYSQKSYLGMFREGANNGTNYYFCNVGLRAIATEVQITGSVLSTPTKTTLHSLIIKYIYGTFFHLIRNRVNSGTYQQGQKMIAGGYIWLNQTYGSNTAASSSPFSGSYTIGSSTVVDGGITWLCIAGSYASQVNFWFDVDRTFLNYSAPDSHDSYASTFVSLIYRWQLVSGDNMSWMFTASQQPSGSGTYYTYKQLFDDIITYNLSNLVNLSPQFLTQVFQSNINPKDGSSFVGYYLEDNCESYQGFADAVGIYKLLNDPTNATNMAGFNADINSGIANMYDSTYNLFKYEYNVPVVSWVNTPNLSWYPYFQSQFWPELYNIASIQNDARLNVRIAISQYFPEWWLLRDLDTFPECVHGFVAASMWQDLGKAYPFIEKVERYYIPTGLLIISEAAYYLEIKDRLTPRFSLEFIGSSLRLINKLQEIEHLFVDRKFCSLYQTANFTMVVPGQQAITAIHVAETAGNSFTLNIGSTPGGTDIVNGYSVSANQYQMIPQQSIIARSFNPTTDTTIYLSGTFNNAKINVQLFFTSLDYTGE